MTDAEIDALQTKDGHILKQRDVFERYGSSVNYFIEVRNTAQAEALVKLIQEFELERFVTVQAWHVAELQIIEKALPESKRMLLVSKQEQLERAVTNTTVQIVSAGHDLMTEANCKLVHDNGKEFSVWTLDSWAKIQKAIELGVDSYFTNYTAKALYLERKYRN